MTQVSKEEKYKLGKFVFTRNSLGHFTTAKLTGVWYEKRKELEFSEEQLIEMGAKKEN